MGFRLQDGVMPASTFTFPAFCAVRAFSEASFGVLPPITGSFEPGADCKRVERRNDKQVFMFGSSISPHALHYEDWPCPHSANTGHIFCYANDYLYKQNNNFEQFLIPILLVTA